MPLDYWDSSEKRSILPDRWRKIVERFVLFVPEKLEPEPDEDEIWDIWKFYESIRTDLILNEKILLALIEERICLDSSLFNLAQHFKLIGEPEKALFFLDKLVEVGGESDDEMYARTQILFNLKNYVVCGKVLRRAHRKYPEFNSLTLVQLRLDFVTCRPNSIMLKRLHSLKKKEEKFEGTTLDWYLALSHAIDSKHSLLKKSAQLEFAKLVQLRTEFKQKRGCKRAKKSPFA